MVWYTYHMITNQDKQRFEGKILKTNDCWVYTGGINSTGRGVFWLNGKSIKAHRFAWIINNGDIKNGLLVCHKCDNGKCVNPEHLFLGTHKDNTQDMLKKGRHAGNRKLSKDDYGKIEKLFSSGVKRKEIAKIFNNISYEHICKILKN